MKKILLTTLNSRFTHTSIALRYLYANLKELQNDAKIIEFSINDAIQTIAEKLLTHSPQIIGIGVYIWNALEVRELIHIIKKISPNTKIVLGGPEVSHEPFRVNLDSADFIIQGEGDEAFYRLCRDIFDGLANQRVIKMSMPSLKNVELPYKFYTDDDIKNRYIYVEASRGCPFECEFCLSSMDEKVRAFDIELFL
ncbi:MAG: cobalamin B12-binding domain-containing protein, partial [Candidatus Magasanikbacteria bacterium]|nr:cobalamin B12-binding domain-containing protein [Candidatus Magasanikbacteria bacterium]